MFGMKKPLTFVGLLAITGANAGAVDLTEGDFDAQVFESGKGAFVKFYAPWCGHCKALKPAWDKLGDEYDGSSTVLIGDVDCTVHQNLCQKYGVQGYPTLKYFTANPMGDAYNGGRDYEELSKFAKESLGPSCGVEHMDLCDAEQKKSLETKMALSDSELDKLIEDSDAKLKQADEDLEALLKGLQQQYEDGKKAKEDAQAALSPELAQLRSVKRSRENGAKQEL
jgi:protein disulfide-isomerase A6